MIDKIVSCTNWTVDDLKSDIQVHFSLEAVNRKGLKGPSTTATVYTKSIGENVIVRICMRQSSTRIKHAVDYKLVTMPQNNNCMQVYIHKL